MRNGEGVGEESVEPSQRVQNVVASVSFSSSLVQSLQTSARSAEKAALSVSPAAPFFPGIPRWTALGAAALMGAAKS